VEQWKRKPAGNFLNVDENRARPTLMSWESARLQLQQIETQPIRERMEEESAGLLQEHYARVKSRGALPKKLVACVECRFYKKVRKEEGKDFEIY
jgi:hypothetical protein